MWLLVLQILLLPVSLLYNLITAIRNWLYDNELIKPYIPPVKTIGVGNLAMGGTGKTPMVEYLIRYLSVNYKIAVLSRGYKRKSKGFIMTNSNTTVDEIGDELFQIHQKFGNKILIVADSNRSRAIQKLIALDTAPDIILLDDAFQHRKVKVGFSILLTTYNKPFFKDRVFPSGLLRENRAGKKRADIIITTKCPSTISENEIEKFKQKINSTTAVYFTYVSYGNIYSFDSGKCVNLSKDISLLTITGFVHTENMIYHLNEYTNELIHFSFPDHYDFKKSDIKRIMNSFGEIKNKNKYIIVSEKDAARISKNPFLEEKTKKQLLVLPIEIKFLQNKYSEEFNLKISDYVGKNQ